MNKWTLKCVQWQNNRRCCLFGPRRVAFQQPEQYIYTIKPQISIPSSDIQIQSKSIKRVNMYVYIYIFRLQCRVCSLIQTQMPWHHELDWRRRNPCRSTIDILAAFSVCTGHPETTSAHINTPKKALMVDHCAWNLVLGAEFKSTLLDVLLRAIWICLTWVKCGNKHRSLQV